MQVFFTWVAAQKLSSCKQRITTSCTSGLHNKRYGSTHYDARSASRGNLRAILIVFILRKSWYFTIFLFFTPKYAIIIYNTGKCWNGLWQYGGNCLDAPPGGGAFFISVRRRYFISARYKKLWKMLIDKHMKKKAYVKRRASAQHLSPRWDGTGMSPRRYSWRFAQRWIVELRIL